MFFSIFFYFTIQDAIAFRQKNRTSFQWKKYSRNEIKLSLMFFSTLSRALPRPLPSPLHQPTGPSRQRRKRRSDRQIHCCPGEFLILIRKGLVVSGNGGTEQNGVRITYRRAGPPPQVSSTVVLIGHGRLRSNNNVYSTTTSSVALPRHFIISVPSAESSVRNHVVFESPVSAGDARCNERR